MEHDNVHDTEYLQNDTNKNLTNVISETKQDDEVLDKIFILMLLKRQILKWKIQLKLQNCNWTMK